MVLTREELLMSWITKLMAPLPNAPAVKQRVDDAFSNLQKAVNENLRASVEVCASATKLEKTQTSLVRSLQETKNDGDRAGLNINADAIDLFCTADSAFHFVELKPEWETVLGWTLDELRAQPFFCFVHPEDVKKTLTETEYLMQHGETVDFKNRYLHKDGRWIMLSWVARVKNGIFYAVARPVPESGSGQHEKITDLGASHGLP